MLKPARTDLAASVSLDARPPRPTTRVWDPFVRLFHWSLVLSFGVAWFSSHPAETLHHWAGYAAAALILMRLLWGMIGTRYARFSQFVRKPATVARYLSNVVSSKEARYVGHNPAGGVMVMALIAAMATTALTGWMMTTERLFRCGMGRGSPFAGCSWPVNARPLASLRRSARERPAPRESDRSHGFRAQARG